MTREAPPAVRPQRGIPGGANASASAYLKRPGLDRRCLPELRMLRRRVENRPAGGEKGGDREEGHEGLRGSAPGFSGRVATRKNKTRRIQEKRRVARMSITVLRRAIAPGPEESRQVPSKTGFFDYHPLRDGLSPTEGRTITQRGTDYHPLRDGLSPTEGRTITQRGTKPGITRAFYLQNGVFARTRETALLVFRFFKFYLFKSEGKG